ncbi:hypothetical protein SmJEL517_g00963 [Synchytrium microbalum]|uniref:cAMP-dependent protein kinase regulatory subunit n=1 Tax=Synchytrium microbalum TaxID=1806994 RepID=A0A507CHF6_9FUNG|nr:uncharacterized protein SmJEL517_g00963 [Synchytrium microbalum]TPX37115.1 hypothetical protein SmJEL517_g00963 [Synchytrium microbalum]
MADQYSQYTVPLEFPELLKDLNREVLRSQPKNIIQFCADYFATKLADQQAKGASDSSEMHLEDDHDDGEDAHDAHDELPDDDDDYEDEATDAQGALPASSIPASYTNRGRRTSVSAESMTPTNEEWIKVVIPKTAEQRSRIEAAIQQNFLFRHLDEEQYVDVINAMAEKRVATGEEVIRQGAVGDFFYVAETGTLDVFVSRNGQPAAKVYQYGPGGSFGELALMYNAPRAATVIATSECILWALDRVTFRRILMENTSRKRRMYEDFLEEVPLLVSLEAYERHKISDALESVTFQDGDIVIKQGDVGENFYIIESGEAAVSKLDENGVESQYPSLKKGDYFGELALLTNKPRAATIKASGRLKCATLGKKAFVRLLGPVVDILSRNADNYQAYKYAL